MAFFELPVSVLASRDSDGRALLCIVYRKRCRLHDQFGVDDQDVDVGHCLWLSPSPPVLTEQFLRALLWVNDVIYVFIAG